MKNLLLKKLAVVGLALTMTAGVAACGNTNQQSTETATEATTEAATEATTEAAPEATAEGAEAGEMPNSVVIPNTGITLGFPDEFWNVYGNSVGMIDITGGDISGGDGVYEAKIDYYALDPAKYEEIATKEERTEDEVGYILDRISNVVHLYSIDEGRGAEEIVKTLKDLQGIDCNVDDFTELEKVDNCTFYEYVGKNEGLVEDQFKEEYDTLCSIKDGIVKASTFESVSRPFDALVGQKLTFETTDMDGNTVKSEDIFSQNEITMVNVWATWCGACVGELADLEKINSNLAAKNCAIVGLVGDGDTKLEEAKKLIADNGVTYLNVMPWEGWNDTIQMAGWPASFFVDKNGTILGTPIVGANVDKYESHIDELLSGNLTAETETSNSSENSENAYRIFVVDENAVPVAGAMVQFCTDSMCMMAVTDADGMASFDETPGVYDVHILQVPDGYEQTVEGFKTKDVYSDMYITIEKK